MHRATFRPSARRLNVVTSMRVLHRVFGRGVAIWSPGLCLSPSPALFDCPRLARLDTARPQLHYSPRMPYYCCCFSRHHCPRLLHAWLLDLLLYPALAIPSLSSSTLANGFGVVHRFLFRSISLYSHHCSSHARIHITSNKSRFLSLSRS